MRGITEMFVILGKKDIIKIVVKTENINLHYYFQVWSSTLEMENGENATKLLARNAS